MGGGWSMPCSCCFTPRKDPVPTAYEAGWAPRLVWMGAENLAPTGIQLLDRPARSESLYRLSSATSQKVMGSIPDGVSGIFHWHNPSGRTMALGLTQPLTEMSTRNISWGLRRPVHMVYKLTTYMCWLSWNLEPTGPIQACNWITLSFTFTRKVDNVISS